MVDNGGNDCKENHNKIHHSQVPSHIHSHLHPFTVILSVSFVHPTYDRRRRKAVNKSRRPTVNERSEWANEVRAERLWEGTKVKNERE